MKPVIEVKNLSKKYQISHSQKTNYRTLRDDLAAVIKKPASLITGKTQSKEAFWALQDVSFNVNQGDVVGIIGKNGSGKSTLLKILSRIVDPTSGEAIMRGRTSSLLEVGTGFHQMLTGRENIYFNGSILGMKKAEIDRKLNDIIEFSEIEKFLDTPVKFYSSGMYVRLAFAVAAHLEPDILIIDEVLAVGDSQFQKKSLGKMSAVAKEGRTVLFVSHNLTSVKALCTKGIFLSDGHIKFQGGIQEAADKYTAFVEKSSSEVPLKDKPRTSNVSLEARITDISLRDGNNKRDKDLDSTTPFELSFTILSKADLDKEILLHCGIMREGVMVTRFMSEHNHKSFKLKKGTNKIICQIEPTLLTGGTYSIDCGILYPGRETLGHIDEIVDAYSFTVEPIKLPNDETLTQREAFYWAPHSWRSES
jgi:lipopolysaccharide transport system ATP-binding protein